MRERPQFHIQLPTNMLAARAAPPAISQAHSMAAGPTFQEPAVEGAGSVSQQDAHMSLHERYNSALNAIRSMPAPSSLPTGAPARTSERRRSNAEDWSDSEGTGRVRSSRRLSARSMREARDSSDEEDYGLEDVPLSERAPRGTATRERRRLQNRIAQRALRERKEQRLRHLEAQAVEYEAELQRLRAENASLREANAQLISQVQMAGPARSISGGPAFAGMNFEGLHLSGPPSAASSQGRHSESSASVATPPNGSPHNIFVPPPHGNMVNKSMQNFAPPPPGFAAPYIVRSPSNFIGESPVWYD